MRARSLTPDWQVLLTVRLICFKSLVKNITAPEWSKRKMTYKSNVLGFKKSQNEIDKDAVLFLFIQSSLALPSAIGH